LLLLVFTRLVAGPSPITTSQTMHYSKPSTHLKLQSVCRYVLITNVDSDQASPLRSFLPHIHYTTCWVWAMKHIYGNQVQNWYVDTDNHFKKNDIISMYSHVSLSCPYKTDNDIYWTPNTTSRRSNGAT